VQGQFGLAHTAKSVQGLGDHDVRVAGEGLAQLRERVVAADEHFRRTTRECIQAASDVDVRWMRQVRHVDVLAGPGAVAALRDAGDAAVGDRSRAVGARCGCPG
jgi:hypothetical protein